jgi:hypothetical protein
VIVTCVAMFTYSQLNKQKEIKCREEGIDGTQAGLFRDMGDASPLFRRVIGCIPVTREIHYIAGILSRQDTGESCITARQKSRLYSVSTVGNRHKETTIQYKIVCRSMKHHFRAQNEPCQKGACELAI